MSKPEYPIANFYVGELYITHELESLLVPGPLSKNNRQKFELKMKTIQNGAIDFQNVHFSRQYINWQTGRRQSGILTIFYKENDNYVCLHNGQSYSLTSEDYIENLVPLATLLPQVDFNIPHSLTVSKALLVFDELMAKGTQQKLITKFHNSFHDIQDFYVGNLNLCSGFSADKSGIKYKYYNLPRRYILYKSSARLGSMFGVDASLEGVLGTYHYDSFKCLFLKTSNTQLYNINSFQMCSNEIITSLSFERDLIGENYLEWLTPFPEVLANNSIKIPKQTTISKALKLYKKTS